MKPVPAASRFLAVSVSSCTGDGSPSRYALSPSASLVNLAPQRQTVYSSDIAV